MTNEEYQEVLKQREVLEDITRDYKREAAGLGRVQTAKDFIQSIRNELRSLEQSLDL